MLRFLLLATLVACNLPGTSLGDDDAPIDGSLVGDGIDPTDGAPPGAGQNVFDPRTTNVVVEIDYEAGAEPFTGPIIGFGDTWDPAVANVDRLFSGRKTVTLPTALAQMENIGDSNRTEWRVADMIAVAMAHRAGFDAPGKKSYYMVFVNGRYHDGTAIQNGVLGVSLGTTGIVVMFKDTIRSTNNPLAPNVVRYVEQSTIIHELGHAVGLTDNGVAMVTPHRDPAHGAHCDDRACVMYYLNEGASDATAYATQRLLTNDTILFDANCLADVDALTGGPTP